MVAVQKWEYLTYNNKGFIKLDDLRKLGEQGWELVCVTQTNYSSHLVAYLKRPAQS